jgi:hypothetical protein
MADRRALLKAGHGSPIKPLTLLLTASNSMGERMGFQLWFFPF